MTKFRWRSGERYGQWKPTRREALAAGRYALSKRGDVKREQGAGGFAAIEVEERHEAVASRGVSAADLGVQ